MLPPGSHDTTVQGAESITWLFWAHSSALSLEGEKTEFCCNLDYSRETRVAATEQRQGKDGNWKGYSPDVIGRKKWGLNLN